MLMVPNHVSWFSTKITNVKKCPKIIQSYLDFFPRNNTDFLESNNTKNWSKSKHYASNKCEFSVKNTCYTFFPTFDVKKRFFFSRNTSKSALANSNFETESVSREKNKSWDRERKPPANWEPRRVRKRGFSASAVVLRVWCMCELRSMVYLLTQ